MEKEENGAVLKGAEVRRAEGPDEAAMAAINRLTLRELSPEEVFVFRVAASNASLDRDLERFTDKSLEDMARLYVGKTVISDHRWSAGGQVARVFAAAVEDEAAGVRRLVLSCYAPRSDATKGFIEAIEGGILKEVSVGVQVKRMVCGICGRNYIGKDCCDHLRGQVYEGKTCTVELDGVSDAYELSFVAVPANAEAGVIKRYEAKEGAGDKDRQKRESLRRRARALLELEKNRF